MYRSEHFTLLILIVLETTLSNGHYVILFLQVGKQTEPLRNFAQGCPASEQHTPAG